MKRLIKIIFFLMVIAVIVIGAGFIYLQNMAKQPIQLATSEQLFVVERGTGITMLNERIVQKKLFKYTYGLPLLIRLEPALRNIKAGTYRLRSDMTLRDFLLLLNSGKEVQLSVQFIEGSKAKDWLEILQKLPLLTQEIDPQLNFKQLADKIGIKNGHIEGWFYPDTYYYTPNSSDIAILRRAYQRMYTELEAVWQNRDANLPYHSAYELLIMASIIEKETAVDSERNLVASVFINRLNRNMKLQTDPTVIYGIGDRYDGNIRRRDLQDNNAYNTYIISGLPPTPIAMPSKASLFAAAHPAESQYLYFVANGQGGHVFSTNLNDHNQAVKAYLINKRKQTSN
ncbi:MAG: endolytic transglycosylase MltG [Candidatus Schmidhempelia sp.]|nr:endolytic transglycosylase MltG [Candidatus Schmidhempelia sp.]